MSLLQEAAASAAAETAENKGLLAPEESLKTLRTFRRRLLVPQPFRRRTLLAALPALLLFLPASALAQNASAPASPAAAPALKISGSVSTPLEISLADLKSMPHKKLTVVNPHDKKTEAYEGVPLLDLLHKAGVLEGEHIRGAAMATYLLATASDGYRVIFSLAELDPAFLDSEVLVADTLDGAPLGPNQGP